MPDALSSVFDPNHPQLQEYRQKSPELLATAQALVITSDDGLRDAAELTKTTSAAVKAIRALFKPAKTALADAKRQIDRIEDGLLAGFEQADGTLRAKVTEYHVSRRKLAEAEARQREEAERKRREDEQINQAARLENLANVTGEAHYKRAAETVLNQPIRSVAIKPEMPKVKGMTFREEVGVTVTSQESLVAAVAVGSVSGQALLPNITWLRKEAEQRATTMQDGDELFPGVIVTKTSDVTVRTR